MSATTAPSNVFSLAIAKRQADVLDRHCIDAAVRAALDSELPRGSLLLVNTEPAVAHSSRSDNPALAEACERFELTFELTERHLLEHPQALMDKVAAIRADGIAIAIDDVGAHPASLAVLDLLAPDVVKLDMRAVKRITSRDRAHTLLGVLAYRERTGAVVVAEGVESDEDLEEALAVGADFAQGFRFGKGQPLTAEEREVIPPRPIRIDQRVGSVLNAATEADRKPLQVAPKHFVADLVRYIEEQARLSADRPIVLAAVPRTQEFLADAHNRYRKLAAKSPLVVVLGPDMPSDLGSGIRSVAVEPDDPVRNEWVVVTLGHDTCRALVAREEDRACATNDWDTRYEYLFTTDRALVIKAARGLLARTE